MKPFPDYPKIQAQIAASNARSSPVVEQAGPFTCFFNLSDAAHYANYAVPTRLPLENLESGLDALLEMFAEYERRPRLEYIEAIAPTLEAALTRRGFMVESRTILMVCTPHTLIPAPAVAGLSLEILDAESSLAQFCDYIFVQECAFGEKNHAEIHPSQAEVFRERYGGMVKALARLESLPVGVGLLTHPLDGITEAAGIGTLPAYRGRGIAAAVTAAIARRGFENGLAQVFLTAANERAGRVYQRVGFEPAPTVQINISLPE